MDIMSLSTSPSVSTLNIKKNIHSLPTLNIRSTKIENPYFHEMGPSKTKAIESCFGTA